MEPEKDRLAVLTFRGKSQDDSVLAKLRYSPLMPLRRRGSSESGFFRFVSFFFCSIYV